MVDVETQMKIDTLLDFSYDKTMERMSAIEEAPRHSIYKTTAVRQGDYGSYLFAESNYYLVCFEGMFFVRFLEEFNRMPIPSENAFIKESVKSKFRDLLKSAVAVADKHWKSTQ